MVIIPLVYNKEDARRAMIAIGQEIIRQADDVCNQLENVSSISIEAVIEPEPQECISVNITKNYAARFEEKEENKNES